MNVKQIMFLALIFLVLNSILVTLGVTTDWSGHTFLRAMSGSIMVIILGIDITFLIIWSIQLYDYLGK
jgi:hypothetical protein